MSHIKQRDLIGTRSAVSVLRHASLRDPCLVVESLRHVGLEPRGEYLCGPEDCGGGPLVGLRDAEQLLPVPVLRDHLEELGDLPAPGEKG